MYIRWDITQHVFVILLTFMIKKKKAKTMNHHLWFSVQSSGKVKRGSRFRPSFGKHANINFKTLIPSI